MKQTAAFFDIDGTLYREGFIADLFQLMVKSELIPYERWYEEVRPEFINYDRRIGTYDDYLVKMATLYREAIQGKHRSLIEHLVDRIIEEKALRTYIYTRKRMDWHRRAGHIIIAISGSPYELVSAMAHFYEMDDFKGTGYLMDENNYYTGEIIPMWDSQSKKAAVFEMVEKHDLDLSACWSYGDTAGDFAMLNLVGHPVMVNPTKELIQMVQMQSGLKEKIQLRVERKDVIYQLDLDNLEIEDDSNNQPAAR